MSRAAVAGLFLLLIAGPVGAQGADDWTDEQQEVWSSVRARWDAWSGDDFERFRAQHHPDWHRWGFSHAGLMSASDLESLWHEFKEKEEYVGVELEPVSVQVLEPGRLAAAHYVARAHVRWVGEPFISPRGQRVERGNETTIPMRWSDFLVKDGARWLYVGGYRDGNCGIWRGYNRPCR